MFFSFVKQKGFSLVELMIVVMIIGLLGNISAQRFYVLKDQSEYERFVFTIQHLVQDARSRAIVNEGKYNGVDFDQNTGYGVQIKRNSETSVTTTLFQDKDQDGLLNPITDLIITEATNAKILKVLSFTGIQSESNDVNATAFNSLVISFQAEPSPAVEITTDQNEKLRSVELKFAHLRHTGDEGLQKKFSFDVISKISEVNDYPILVDAQKINDSSIRLHANEVLTSLASVSDLNTFKVFDDANNNYTVNSANVDASTIVLNTELLPDNTKLNIIYNSNSEIKTDVDNIILQSRQLEIR